MDTASQTQITNKALGPFLSGLLEGGGDLGFNFIKKIVPNFITLGFILASVVFFFMILYGAIQWITSGGDKGAVESARGRVTSAIIGIAILFAMYAIIRVVETFFNTSIVTLDIDPLKIQ